MSDVQRPPRFANVLIVVVIVILAPTLTIAAIYWQTGALPQLGGGVTPPQIPPAGTQETLVLNTDAPSATTQSGYDGRVRLVAEGSMLAPQGGLRDLFYRHTDELGASLATAELLPPLLMVDGAPITDETPAYNPFHVYDITFERTDAVPIVVALDPATYDPATAREIRVFIVPLRDTESSP